MKILITGGTGQLGLALQAEMGLRSIDFLAPSSSEVDIGNTSQVEKTIKSIKPNVIINAAAWTNVDGAESNQSEAYSANTLGPQYLAVAARNIGARLIHISTDYVFSGQGSTPWPVSAEHNPQSFYGKSKSEGEKLVLNEYSEGSYIVRTGWLYSANRKNFAKTMTKLAMQGNGELRVVSDQIGQPTFAGDLAKQIVNLALSGTSAGTYHGTNSGQSTWFEFAQEIFKFTGADISRIVPVSTTEYPSSAIRPAFSVLSHDGWANTSIPAMRDWKIALQEAMPYIISEVNAE